MTAGDRGYLNVPSQASLSTGKVARRCAPATSGDHPFRPVDPSAAGPYRWFVRRGSCAAPLMNGAFSLNGACRCREADLKAGAGG
jgi:hypothetical protein